MKPTADHIGMAIVAACRGTGVDPAEIAPQIAQGVSGRGRGSGGPIRVVRAYAALALRAVFDDCPQVSIARMVGSIRTEAYFPSLDVAMRLGRLGWWSDHVFMGVIAEVERVRPARVPVTALKTETVIRVRRALGAIADIDGMGDRPANRLRAEQIIDER